MLIICSNIFVKLKLGVSQVSMRRNLLGFIAAVFLSVTLLAPPTISAQQGGSGLQLSPTRTELTVNPGERETFTISLKNITQSKFAAQVSLNDFESDNVSGIPKILVDTNDRTPYTISKMLSGLQDIQLAPGETKEIKATIDVPENIAPGAYYGAVRYAVVPPDASQADRQIALNASVAHLVLIEVPGNTSQQIQIQSLKMQKNDKPGTIFFSRPDKAALAVKNLGNGFSRPFGSVAVNNMFGKEVYGYDVNNTDPRSIVLPNSSRTYVNEVGGIAMPGKYSITASVAYGNGAEVVTYKSTFWYLPIWFIVVVSVLILALVGSLFAVYRRKKIARRK